MQANARQRSRCSAALTFAAIAAATACSRDDAPARASVTQEQEGATTQRPASPAAPEVGRDPTAVSRSTSAPMARASLRPTEGNTASGVVEFTEMPDGTLDISVELAGLAEGKHGLHIHENGDCSAADASSAGGHFSPDGRTHGSPADTIHHAGDLGNVTADSEGVVVTQLDTADLRLTGRYGVVDRAVVVHGGEDDLRSQPDGNSGDPVACGVVTMVGAPAASG